GRLEIGSPRDDDGGKRPEQSGGHHRAASFGSTQVGCISTKSVCSPRRTKSTTSPGFFSLIGFSSFSSSFTSRTVFPSTASTRAPVGSPPTEAQPPVSPWLPSAPVVSLPHRRFTRSR